MRREFSAICCYPNICCHKMITRGPILTFLVSMEPYWSAQHDRIFENGATAFLVAKIGPKWIPHIWVVWRPTELTSGNQAAEINCKIILNRYYRLKWSCFSNHTWIFYNNRGISKSFKVSKGLHWFTLYVRDINVLLVDQTTIFSFHID